MSSPGDEIGFIQAIQAEPESDSLVRIYADWLEERGDVRAQYLRLMLSPPVPNGDLKKLREHIDPAWLSLWLRARLRVGRGAIMGMDYPIYEGANYIGTDSRVVDIDLTPQQPWFTQPPNHTNWAGNWGSADDPVRCYPLHAMVACREGKLSIEDLRSPGFTFVSRRRVHPGQPEPLQANDVIQIGNVQLRVLL
ncbi:hypothetical protein AYO44_11440 [Planctomycetaceae bacterium SCGC AG-212-F19]|nr:hypothetical protein AYO44_11440 [Planctomycetaceae bacterium SCGC AG-212-F19]